MNHRYVARRISKNVFIVWGKSGRCEDPGEKVGGGEKEGRRGGTEVFSVGFGWLVFLVVIC